MILTNILKLCKHLTEDKPYYVNLLVSDKNSTIHYSNELEFDPMKLYTQVLPRKFIDNTTVSHISNHVIVLL